MGWSNAGWRSSDGGWYKNAAAGGGSNVSVTFQSQATGNGVGSNFTTSAVAVGTASANRRVIVLGWGQGSPGAPLGTSTIGGVAVDTNQLIGTDSAAGTSYWVASAVVPTGTTAAASIDFGSSATGFNGVAFYTVDTTTLTSPTSPVTGFATTASATSLAGSVNTLAGGALLVLDGVSGGATPTVSSSDETLTADLVAGNFLASWHANIVSARTPSNVNISWTGTGSSGLALVAYK